MSRSCSMRPKKSQPFSLTEFRTMVRESFLHNLKSGMLLDLTKKTEEHEIITRTGLEHALKEAEKSVKSIDLFLADQLKDNSSLEQELKTVTQLKQKMKKELDLALKKMGDLKVDLFKRIENIRDTMQCRDFLHTVSPQAWLAEYQTLLETHKTNSTPSLDKLCAEFENFMSHMGAMDMEVEKIVKEFIEIFQNSGPELLPFKEGRAISTVIKKMERNNMEMLVHVRTLQKPLEDERAMLNDVTTIYKEEISEVVRTLNEITGNYTFLKERNARMESIIHDMMKNFKGQVASEEVLRDRALLESLYKHIVNSKKSKTSVLEMWKEIDEKFIELQCKVGASGRDEIERRRITINKLSTLQLKEAEKARNRVMQMEQMVKGVRKSFWAPAAPATSKPLRPRSEPPPAPLRSPPPQSPPGEDYTSELAYLAKLVTPLAVGYDVPQPGCYSGYFAQRDCVDPEERNADDGAPLASKPDPRDSGVSEILEIPKLPAMEPFKAEAEETNPSE